ncbi:ATP-binding protein [Streptomyces sp. SID12501]|uniref:ATP-binding protein n=1 Tax=Streptomyces sp. SID12501 TaxID=2706042 RepID=A0A6B3C6T9_9ACTN|nr:ATP-binding protein [Streptomyces sp. SID12501]NEC92369.1 ATP-binding protein [Streptomyces sp. SID12501]
MPTLVTRIVLAGTEGEVSPARRAVVDQVRAWGVPLDDETADTIRLVASELITNGVVHGEGPVTVVLYHRPGSLVIEVLDGNPGAPTLRCAQAEDESGRGVALVDFLAVRSGWEPVGRGKRVWAQLVIPKPAPAVRAAVLRQFFAIRPIPDAGTVPEPLALAVT